jgi:hypothetical protein
MSKRHEKARSRAEMNELVEFWTRPFIHAASHIKSTFASAASRERRSSLTSRTSVDDPVGDRDYDDSMPLFSDTSNVAYLTHQRRAKRKKYLEMAGGG